MLSVWILETWYEDGDHEINCVCETEEKAQKEINELTDHLKVHIHDYHSRRGLLKKVGQRRSMLQYLAKKDIQSYREVIKKLGLRK